MLPRFLSAVLIVALALGCQAASSAHADAPSPAAAEPPINTPPKGFTALFNGKDLMGWTGGTTRDYRAIQALPEAEKSKWYAKQDEGIAQHWRVDAATGELVSDGHEPHLVTKEAYGDFEFWVDYKIQANGDSGIYLRGVPQVQIWDPANPNEKGNGADKGSAGLWNNNGPGKWPLVKADRAPGEWNRLHVTMVGSRVWVELNGQKTVDGAVLENYYKREIAVPQKGPIHLQTHGNEVRFRNVFVRSIGSDEANGVLAKHAESGAAFTDLFAHGLEGWQGAKKAVEQIPEGIRWKKDGGGTLFTKEKYADFEQTMEFKLTAGANNGLAVRYPGKGDTSYTGIEVQVLDTEDPGYKDLHSYQTHGSVYGFIPAQRGYLRPLGEWNYQVLRVKGTHYTVELNGFTIVDADLKGVKQLDGDDRAGEKALDGYFGFAGHGDEVSFRRVHIRRLDK